MRLRYISIPALITEARGDPWAIDTSLQAGRPAQIVDLARAFRAAGRCAAESMAAFENARRRFAASFSDGDHPINDSAAVRRLTRSVGAQAVRLPEVGVDLEDVAAFLDDAQRTAGVLVSTLETRLQQLDDQLGHALEFDNDVHRTAAAALISSLEQQAIDDTTSVLSRLESIRSGYAHRLRASRAALRNDGDGPAGIRGLDAPSQPDRSGTPVAIPAANTRPDEVKKWWDALSRQDKDELIAAHPPQLGNLNGINAAVRDAVNESVLNDDINRVDDVAERRGVSVAEVLEHPGRYGLSATGARRYRNAARTRDGLIYDRGPAGPNQRPVLLWAYDPLACNGWGAAAIAIGNPDYARGTAVIVPGAGSSVARGWLSGHQDAVNLYDQSLAADPGHHYTSVIAWMGYEAPQGISDTRVVDPGLARAGGELLSADVNGLRATHNSLTPQRITVIGHSYGSTTVADAFAHSNMRADYAVLIGSPGTDFARSAADFGLPGGHVYVGSASTDPISRVGESHGMPVGWLKQLLWTHGVPIPPDAGLGRDPAGDGYGSIRFHAEVPGPGSVNGHDHSHYYVKGSESLRSITDIVSGHPERLATDGMLADGRRQPHIGPFRIPGAPGYVDPEAGRPRNTIHDDHAYPAYKPP